MEFEIQAGAKIQTLTPDEASDMLNAWLKEIQRGVKFRRGGGQVTASATTFRMDNAVRNGRMGPESGFMWSVLNVAVKGGQYKLGTDTFDVYMNDVSGLTVVATGVSRQIGFGVGQVVLNSQDFLVVAGGATDVNGTDVNVTLLVAEVPVQLAWQFL